MQAIPMILLTNKTMLSRDCCINTKPSADDRQRRLCGELPLLLPSSLPISREQERQTSLEPVHRIHGGKPELNEVIFSGGDPLMAKDDEIHWLLEHIAQIPHIKRLRIHSRLPVVIPARITDELCQLLKASRLQIILVTHINHANEINDELRQAMKKLKEANVTLLNQGVLLKGVNDSVDALIQLSEALFDAGIMPYYLHVLDKVQGAAHFMVDDERARQLMAGLLENVSGYLIPTLTREIGGRKSKTPLDLHLA